MERFEVTAHYATWSGHHASCRRIVEAEDAGQALDIVAGRIKSWKRYMGKLDLDCIKLREGNEND
jgi:hypothetical protein